MHGTIAQNMQRATGNESKSYVNAVKLSVIFQCIDIKHDSYKEKITENGMQIFLLL